MLNKNRYDLIEILAIDDDRMILRLVYDTLVRLGFKAITMAFSGRHAIDLLTERPYDIIITDWRMEEMDGMAVVDFVRRSLDSTCPQAPIIMLTSVSEAKQVIAARDAGINEYLIKPFSAEQLLQRLRAVIERPKPFVTGPTYQGPDRRHSERPPPGKDRRQRKSRKDSR
jgi:two-component system, chemotaxis family, chemotaxis protein CheY